MTEAALCRVAEKRGTHGPRIEVAANMARLVAKEPSMMVYIYAVYMDGDEPEHVRRAVVKQLESQLGHFNSYDGIYLYVPAKLDKKILRFEANHPVLKGEKVLVRVMYRTKTTVGCCSGLLKSLLSLWQIMLGYKRFHRVYFDPNSGRKLPNSDVEVYGAFRVRLAQAEIPMLVFVDVVHMFRRTRTVSQVFDMTQGEGDSREEKLRNYCLGRVVTNYNDNDVFHVSDVSFGDFDGAISPVLWAWKKVSVEHNLRAKPWKRECVQLDPRKYSVAVTRNGHQPSYEDKLPIEAFTRVSPSLRVKCIKRFLEAVCRNNDCQAALAQWRLQLITDLVCLQARVLPSPYIYFGDGGTKGYKQFWDPKTEAPTRKFLKPVSLKHWKVFCVREDMELADKLISALAYKAETYGVRAQRGKLVQVPLKDHPHWTAAFSSKILEEVFPSVSSVQFLVIVIPSLDGPEVKGIYSRLKKICMTDCGIVSQMINARTLASKSSSRRDGSRQWDLLVGSLLANITCKLGGILWAVRQPLAEKTMFVGLDVWHGDPRRKYSVGAVVFSLNVDMSMVHSCVRNHKFKQEIFDDIRDEFVIALRRFQQENGGLPERILVYRDGVNRPLYGNVLQQELPQILSAVDEVYGTCTPRISFVVVQKRIYERFFCTNDNGYVVNPPPGTVVDHSVTRRRCYDFYLCSMYRVKGTSVPTHYVMLYDNSNMTPDLFQETTQAMCYSYCNWPGSFYIPSVVQYAHKLAGLSGKCGGAYPVASLSGQLHFL